MIPRIVVALCACAVAVGAVIATHDFDPDVMVLCSNNESTCKALVDDYQNLTGTSAQMIRMPTTEALAQVRSGSRYSEFDVWIGGPAEAYELADKAHALAPHQLSAPAIPQRFRTSTWLGTYGGVLAFCVTQGVKIPHTWEDLAHYQGRVVLPLAFTSGTAATMLAVQSERLGERSAAIAYMKRLHENTIDYTSSGTDPARLVRSGRADVAVTFAPYCQSSSKLVPPQEEEALLPSFVFPEDGTGFEVGAGAVLARGRVDAGRAFLEYAVSNRGQQIMAQVEGQSPVSLELPNNLTDRLAQLDQLGVEIFTRNIDVNAEQREALLHDYARTVMYPHGVIGPLWRSFSLACVGALIATIMGALLAVAYRLSGRARWLIAVLACAPILCPSVAVAAALSKSPFSLNPYSGAILCITFALCGVPLAFVIHVALSMNVSSAQLMSAANLGSSPLRTLAVTAGPHHCAASAISLVFITLWFMLDDSAGAAYGGRHDLLINMAITSVNLGRRESLGALAVYVALAVCAAAVLGILYRVMREGRCITRNSVSDRSREHPREHVADVSENFAHAHASSSFMKRYFSRERLFLFGFVAVWTIVLVGLVAVMIANSAEGTFHVDGLSWLGTKALIGVMTTVVAVVVGIACTVCEWRFPGAIHTFMIFLLLCAPVAVGLWFTLTFRQSIQIGTVTVLPPLVGRYSFAGGTLAVTIAYLAVTIPLAYFFIALSRPELMEIARSARAMGSVTMRVLALLMHQIRGRLMGVAAIIFGVTLAQTATLSFVQPAYFGVESPNLVSLAEGGMEQGIFSVSLLVGALGTLVVAMGGLAIRGWGRKN